MTAQNTCVVLENGVAKRTNETVDAEKLSELSNAARVVRTVRCDETGDRALRAGSKAEW
jgi:hypothetical protein